MPLSNNRNYRYPSARSGPDLAAHLAALAEDVDLDMAEVSEMAQDAASRAPSLSSTDDHLLVLLDALRRETWIGARKSDGGPTDWAMEHLYRRLGLAPVVSDGEYLFAVTDAGRRLTDLAVRATDGQFPDYVVDRLRERIMDGYTPPYTPPVSVPVSGSRVYADAPWSPGSDVFPVRADMSRAAGFGSSSMQNMAARFAALFTSRGASWYDGGKGSELIQHTAARMGAIPALVTFPDNTVPASGAVDVTVSNIQLTGALKAYPGTLGGVAGVLSNRALESYVFTRTGTGSAVKVGPDAPFIPDAVSYRDALVLLWMGKNNMGATDAASTVPALTAACFDWLAPLNRRALVLGHFTDTNTPAGGVKRANTKATNTSYARRYGPLFIDVDSYITGEAVWADTGITPTPEDREQQALGNKPPSLSQDAGHLSRAAEDAIALNLITPRLSALGWT